MSFITEALMAAYSALFVDPVVGMTLWVLSLVAMGATSGLFSYMLGKAAGKEASLKDWYHPNVDEIVKSMEGLDDWDLLYLIFVAEKRLNTFNETVLIGMPESIKA